MVLTKARWLIFAVATCFAILQALQPFIHAHIDVDHPIQNTGFHVGDEHEEAVSFEHLSTHSVSNVPHASHTISVASGIKQDLKNMSFADALIAIVLSFSFLLVLSSSQRLNPAFLLVPKESLKRRLPASRAPPQI